MHLLRRSTLGLRLAERIRGCDRLQQQLVRGQALVALIDATTVPRTCASFKNVVGYAPRTANSLAGLDSCYCADLSAAAIGAYFAAP
ncbi:hypothetical protein X551_02386 [Methylibium sp. T29]|nr:hypothetical protein X551_02386 [Methylibium sp. T29]EWS59100.1 hypothetical protein Y694_03077 [Methylibium sp. T29-B]